MSQVANVNERKKNVYTPSMYIQYIRTHNTFATTNNGIGAPAGNFDVGISLKLIRYADVSNVVRFCQYIGRNYLMIMSYTLAIYI